MSTDSLDLDAILTRSEHAYSSVISLVETSARAGTAMPNPVREHFNYDVPALIGAVKRMAKAEQESDQLAARLESSRKSYEWLDGIAADFREDGDRARQLVAVVERERDAIGVKLVEALRENGELRDVLNASIGTRTALADISLERRRERNNAWRERDLARAELATARAELEQLRAEVRRGAEYPGNLGQLACPDPAAHVAEAVTR